MTDTPRTDRVARGRSEIASPTVVDVEFARQLERELAAAQAEIAALREDAERLEWVLPILSGDDTPEATARALKLAGAVLMQLSGRAAIDAAMGVKS